MRFMDERDNPLLLTLPLIAGVAAASIFAAQVTGAALSPAHDAQVIADIVIERACIVQYGPGEYSGKRKMACAAPMSEVPANALSYPLARQ